MKIRKMLLQALLCLILIVSLMSPASVVGANPATAEMTNGVLEGLTSQASASVAWDCPLGGVALVAPNPSEGRPYLSVPVACTDITVSGGAQLWGIYYLVETGPQAGTWLWYIPGFATSTLTQLEPNKYYWVVVSSPCVLALAHVDTAEPVISDIGVSAITQTSATVTWNTDEKATSLVEYGTTANYGMSSVLDTNLVTNHSVALSGLTADKTYHFRVKSSDSSGNLATSGDATFDTSPVLALPVFTMLSEQTITRYEYDENGKLIGAYEYGTIQVSDGLGNTCTGTVTVTYAILAGKAKPLRKTILIPYDYGDTSRFASSPEPVPILSPVEFVLDYQYDENGRLLGGTTYVTLENVGAAGDVTATCRVSTTTCQVIFHMSQGERVKLTAHLPSTALGGYSVKYVNWEWRPALASDIAQGQVDVERL
jgi:hypothetical protein